MRYTQPADQLIPELAGLQRRFLIAGGAGAGVSLVGLLTNHAQFFRSYLVGYMFVLGATLGCLALGMIHQLSGGAWGVVTRRLIGAASRVLPVLTALFLPIVIGMHDLYEWTHADVVAADPILSGKQVYLNTPFFLARAGLYFLVWNLLTYFLNAWSLEQDRNPDPRIARRMQALSGGGLLAFAVTTTFASFDWLMSLDPHWYSTIYGILTMGGQGLTALALLIVALTWLSRRPPLDAIVVPSHFHDLANLMLAFVMLWAYFSFSQWLIIWSGNLPEEIGWYLNRIRGGWGAVALLLVILQFALPFMLLLSRDLKRHGRTLLPLALFIIFMRGVDLFWMVVPNFPDTVRNFQFHWAYLVAPIALLGVWIVLFFSYLRTRPLIPLYEPQVPSLLSQSEHGH